jgi:hypothetical protein
MSCRELNIDKVAQPNWLYFSFLFFQEGGNKFFITTTKRSLGAGKIVLLEPDAVPASTSRI